MLPKPARLNLKKDFKWVASGKKLETKYLRLFLRVGDPSTNSWPRIGIAVSSKSFKKATDRNRAKRIVSSAFQSLYSLLPLHLNIVALPKTGVLGVKSGDVLLDLEEALKHTHVIPSVSEESLN